MRFPLERQVLLYVLSLCNDKVYSHTSNVQPPNDIPAQQPFDDEGQDVENVELIQKPASRYSPTVKVGDLEQGRSETVEMGQAQALLHVSIPTVIAIESSNSILLTKSLIIPLLLLPQKTQLKLLNALQMQ